MRTLPAELINTLSSQSPQYFKRIYLYARQWNGSAYAYGPGVELSGELLSTTSLKIKLDKESYGEWTYSNCSLTFRNERNRFKQGNASGYFGSNKIIRGSKLTIEAGSMLPDGTERPAAIFTGFIFSEPVYDPDEKTVTFSLLGHLAAFEQVNAESISTTYADILLGSDSGTEFSTTTDKVGIISAVKKGPTAGGPAGPGVVALNAGDDYSSTGLDAIGPPAKITLTNALTSGESIWATWQVWHENKTIEWVVAQLCATAGITEREISPVVFDNQVEYEYTQDTQAQWESGTRTRIDSASYPGSLQLAKLPLFGRETAAWMGSSGIVMLFKFSHGTALMGYQDSRTGTIFTGSYNDTGAYGTWDFRLMTALSSNGYGARLLFINNAMNALTPGGGYACGLDAGTGKIKLWRVDSGIYTELWASAGSNYYFGPQYGLDPLNTTQYYRIRVTRDTPNTFYLAIYDNAGNLKEGSFTVPAAIDGTYTTAQWYTQVYSVLANMQRSEWLGLYFMKQGDSIAKGGGDYEQNGNYISPAIDASAALSYWGSLSTSQNVPTGTGVVLETREKANPGDPWSAWTPVLASGQINATKRYLQLRWNPNSGTAQDSTPILYSWTARYYTNTVTIPLVKMRGLTCLEALEQLAQMCCYELGFNAQDVFIFRPRNSSLTSVATLDGSNIEKINTLSDGSDRVYNRIVAEYGQYRVVADPNSEGEPAPTSQDKYGTRELSISAGNFLLEDAANLAIAVAPTVYAYTKNAKRRVTVDAKFNLALELGDRVTVNYPEGEIFTLWKWGDGNAAYGNEGFKYYSGASLPGAMLLAGVDMRVEGIELDLETWRTRYDLVEVL